MIRLATIEDLPSVAKVHAICFPGSYSTQLSKWHCFDQNNLLSLFYREFLTDNPELFVVAEDKKNGIVGFCMGYYMDKDDQVQSFMRNNRVKILWKTILLMLAGNKQTWKKMISRFKHKPVVSDWVIINDKYEHILNNERGDLLSVCVLPDFRGKGYAQGMMDLYLLEMKKAGRKLCLLSVKQDNERARRYYERNGFELYRTRGNEGFTYMKLI